LRFNVSTRSRLEIAVRRINIAVACLFAGWVVGRPRNGLRPFLAWFYDDYYDTVMLVPGAAALLGDGDVTLGASLHVAHRWLSRTDACALLPFPGPAQRARRAGAPELLR